MPQLQQTQRASIQAATFAISLSIRVVSLLRQRLTDSTQRVLALCVTLTVVLKRAANSNKAAYLRTVSGCGDEMAKFSNAEGHSC
jgi:hypothetical protein